MKLVKGSKQAKDYMACIRKGGKTGSACMAMVMGGKKK
jgi:hypothetical protein